MKTDDGFAGRIEALAAELRSAGLDAYFCASAITMGYLHGFHETGGERFLVLAVSKQGQVRMICPGLSANQARRCGLRDVQAWEDGEDPLALLGRLAAEWDLRRVAVDDEMGAWQLLAMQGTLPQVGFRPGHPVISRLMRVKREEELVWLHRAGAIADTAFSRILGQIRAGMTERQVCDLVSEAMRQLGGVPTFCIAAAGANSAEPHHHSDETVLKEGDALVLDFGCSDAGYQSDITRTVSIGKAPAELKDIYRIVHEAHWAGRRAVKAGVPGQEIDRAARRVIVEAGYGACFMHRTGHGIGLRGHEEPYLIEGNAAPLQAGECFSVEPGIYLPGTFGVRIENCVVCTPEGHRSLNEDPSPSVLELG